MNLLDGLAVIVGLSAGSLVYTYAIFPLVMAIIGRLKPSPLIRPDELPPVSLIIPAHNEEEVIELKIKNSLALDYQNLEIIVVCDASSDRTAEIVKTFPNIQLIELKQRQGKTAAVAAAVEASNAPVLCLCDANVMFRPDALWRLMARIKEDDVGAVTGDVRLKSEDSSFGLAESLYYKLERSIHRGESNLGAVVGVDGGMFVIRRELFPKLPHDTILDDFSISMEVLRSGNRLLYEPTAIADENATEAAASEYRRRIRIGAGVRQVLTRGYFPKLTQPISLCLFASHKLARWISPWLLLIVLMSTLILSFSRWYYGLIFTVGLVILLLAALGAVSARTRKVYLVVVPFYFVLIQFGIALGMLRGLKGSAAGAWSRTARKPLMNTDDS